MSPEARLRGYVRTVLFMLVLTFVCISAVAFLHAATQERVRQNESLYLRRAIRMAAGLPPLADARAMGTWFDADVTPAEEPGGYVVRTDAGAVQVAVRSGAGLWGRITAVVGWRADAALTGLTFTEQVETPGLGARIAEPWFQEQFRGKRGPFRLVPEGTRSPAPDTVDAITGATITSTAVRDIVNRALAEGGAAAAPGANTP